MRDSVDKALDDLFNLAAKSPQGIKSIFFSENGKVDCRSIRRTEDYDNSRIPSEPITLARNILSHCYGELEQMEALFFLYYYGALKQYLPQLQIGLSILTGESLQLIEVVAEGYRKNKATPLAEIAKRFNIGYDSANNKCRKIRSRLEVLKSDIAAKIEVILIDAEFLKYLS